MIQLNRTYRRKTHCTFSLKFSSRARKDLFIKTKAEKPSVEMQQTKRCSITIPLRITLKPDADRAWGPEGYASSI